MTAKRKRSERDVGAAEFLELARQHLDGVGRDVGKLSRLGEKMADYLLAGGGFLAPSVASFWTSEFRARAGGLMCLNGRSDCAKDVAFFALPSTCGSALKDNEIWQELLKGKCHCFVVGRAADVERGKARERIEGFTGGCWADRGLYRYGDGRVLASTRPLEMLLRGWLTLGEMIAACTRAERMPTIWMSVWFEGALARNNVFMIGDHGNYGEPFEYAHKNSGEFFHDDRFVPPLPRNHVAEEFLKAPALFVEALEGQLDKLARAGRWMAEAHRRGKTIHAVAAGHSHPPILDIQENSDYPVQWGPPNSNTLKSAPENLGPGDVLLHLGYAPIHHANIEAVLRRGVRVIHTTPYGPRKPMARHRNFLYFDLPWRPGDAWVDVPGYSVRILPSSSVAHAIAYPAILCEFAKAAGWGQ